MAVKAILEANDGLVTNLVKNIGDSLKDAIKDVNNVSGGCAMLENARRKFV